MANKQTIIGKTAPVPLGQQKATNSLPVVFAEDQPPIPVEEQNKIQSEVALSLLGIPRAEVALGIFADVNTYDVNPSEWSQFPLQNDPDTGTGINHLAEEAGAEVVAAEGETAILTSKRFFRYQPGRVSSSTMGVKMNRTRSTYTSSTIPLAPSEDKDIMKGAPTIKKWGIFDKFDGYYFEVINGGDKNDFRCIRRTQALSYSQPTGVESTPDRWTATTGAGSGSNIANGNWGVVGDDPVIYRNGLCYVAAAIYDPSLCYDPADVQSIEDGSPLSDFTYDEGYAVRLAYRDSSGQFVEHMAGRQFQFPFDQRESNTFSDSDYESWKTNGEFLRPSSTNGGEYIRLDAHCKWEDIVTNLSRGGGTGFDDQIGTDSDSVGPKIDVSPGDARFGYDPEPNESNSGVKVWNLLVTVQGSTQITNGEFDSAFGANSHRSAGKEYNTSSTDPGTRNVTLKEWFKICVPPQYRMVYEWRPVRAMFSNDQLNGTTNTVRWSDVSTANVDPSVLGVKRPGDPVFLDGQPLTDASVYDVDFTKVTMWKIEFSWYGAVGALFLCYVPVANGEARWVRVHHMRASNQLDVASLGNATLPITYLTHAGPSNGLPDSGKSTLVKYGASYYIDGGDKGTVKLLSKSSDYAKSVAYSGIKTPVATVPASNYFSILSSIVPQAQKDQLIGSYLKNDTTMRVIWVENDSTDKVRLYFNQATSAFTNGDDIEIVVPRRQRAMVALRAKDEVTNTTGTPIRNRIQLYPIKYGIGVTQPAADTSSNVLTLNFIKNPLLITNNLNNSSLDQSYPIEIYSDSEAKANGFDIGSGTVAVEIVENENITTSDYDALGTLLPTSGDYIHVYMRGMATGSIPIPTDSNPIGGFPANPSVSETSVLVRLFKKGNKFFIQNFSSKPEPFTVYGNMIPVRMYQFSKKGSLTLFSGDFNHSQYEDQKKWNESGNVGTFESIAELSGASVSQDFRLSPVADTGSTIFSIYTNQGGSQYDLTDYFAYNKEYISYPLTDEVDILCAYAMWESTSATSQPSHRALSG